MNISNPAWRLALAGVTALLSFSVGWQSKFVSQSSNGALKYMPDENGNVIPDFSRVGYYQGNKEIPNIPVVITINPSADAQQEIQAAIDALSKKPIGSNGFRGAILLKKGTYELPASILIRESGIVLRGEGEGTKLIATTSKQYALISVNGNGSPQAAGPHVKITDKYVPTGSFSFNVSSAKEFKVGDEIIVLRPGTAEWIHDLKMDQIEMRDSVKQWQPKEYDLEFQRTITKIDGNKIYLDNPVVMAMDEHYGGGEIYKYSFPGRIHHVGIENLYCESVYASDTAENHGWDAVHLNRIQNGWVQNVTARYFGYSCVNLGQYAKYITVRNSKCLDAKSMVTGGRRYSFNNDGQLNLVMYCETTEGRHDYVTGARTLGPNVFYHCTSSRTHADIGPHHRWAAGTLFDNIVTDGEINVQDRGNWGTGHGWAGVTQVLWNCTAKRVALQNPYVSGKNYCIGLKGEKYDGRLKDRPDGEWEGQNKDGLQPASLYAAQMKARGAKLQ